LVFREDAARKKSDFDAKQTREVQAARIQYDTGLASLQKTIENIIYIDMQSPIFATQKTNLIKIVQDNKLEKKDLYIEASSDNYFQGGTTDLYAKFNSVGDYGTFAKFNQALSKLFQLVYDSQVNAQGRKPGYMQYANSDRMAYWELDYGEAEFFRSIPVFAQSLYDDVVSFIIENVSNSSPGMDSRYLPFTPQTFTNFQQLVQSKWTAFIVGSLSSSSSSSSSLVSTAEEIKKQGQSGRDWRDTQYQVWQTIRYVNATYQEKFGPRPTPKAKIVQELAASAVAQNSTLVLHEYHPEVKPRYKIAKSKTLWESIQDISVQALDVNTALTVIQNQIKTQITVPTLGAAIFNNKSMDGLVSKSVILNEAKK
jgi:hypothetical protein